MWHSALSWLVLWLTTTLLPGAEARVATTASRGPWLWLWDGSSSLPGWSDVTWIMGESSQRRQPSSPSTHAVAGGWPLGDDGDRGESGNKTLVPVTLGVMSRCPDAMTCENIFGRVLDRTGHVNLTLAYITTPVHPRSSSSLSRPHRSKCKHGKLECQGNIQQLCFKHYYPAQRDWFDFVNCQNFNSKDIGTETGIESCAKALRKDPGPVERCARGKEGRRLFEANAQMTREAGIETSCTIIINGRKRCVVDGGAWRDCDSLDGHDAAAFVRAIEQEYKRLNGE